MIVFQTVQALYWLALASWFGGALFVAVAAPVILRTVRKANPILPEVLSVNLENEHGSLLASEIVGNILRTLSNVQLGCAAVILVTLITQWFIMDHNTRNISQGIIRSTLFLAALALVLYDRLSLWPKIAKSRQEYIDHADEPDVANAAKDQFDRLGRESERVLFILVSLLLLIIFFSAAVTPAWII